MGKSSIHLQTATAGTILHNARENYSKSVVFPDEKNELWNDSKTAFKLFRDELEIRSNAYTQRTKQKLQKNTSTMISAVVNLEQHHTLKDLEDLKNYIEKEFDTKIIQMAIHRDEGKLINKNNSLDKLVSGKDFFLNPKDNELYFDNKFTKKINMDEWKIEKNYHGHFEMLGIDSQGNSLRKKMNMYKLSKLQDFTAQTLKMERTPSNVEVVKENGVVKVKRKTTKNKKRLDTNEYKEQAKIINEFNMASDNEKNKIIKKANEIIKNHKIDKKKLKEDLDFVKNEFKSIREMLKGTGATREDFKKIDDLNKQLQNDLKNNEIDIKKSTEEIKNLVIDLKLEVYNNEYTQNNKPMKNIDLANHFINENEKKEIEINKLENQNKSLEEQINTLTIENLDLKEKINSSANMSDYEQIKKENEELKKENTNLKEKIKSILAAANEKIKSLFQFKVWNNYKHKQTKLDLEYINENKADFWDELAHYHPKIETLYSENIENELIKIPGETPNYAKMNLENILNLNKEDLKEFKKEATKELKELLEENKQETVVHIRKLF